MSPPIVLEIRAFLDRHELMLAHVVGEYEDYMALVPIYAPIRTLSPNKRDGYVVVDELYPKASVPLDFELHTAPEVAEINGQSVNREGGPTRLAVLPTAAKRLPRRQRRVVAWEWAYEIEIKLAGGKTHSFTFGCKSVDGWQGSTIVEDPPLDVPLDPALGRPVQADDRSGAIQLLMPFLKLMEAGDYEPAYQLCADIYRSIVGFDRFSARLERQRAKMAERSIVEHLVETGANRRYPSMVVTKTIYGVERVRGAETAVEDTRGINGFFTVAPVASRYKILAFAFNDFTPLPESDEPDYELLI